MIAALTIMMIAIAVQGFLGAALAHGMDQLVLRRTICNRETDKVR